MAQKIFSLILQSLPKRSSFSVSKSIYSLSGSPTTKSFSTSTCLRSLDEFFDDPKNLGERQVKSGRPWRTDELRLKSNSDLHKLWFVLYKERNMLYTMLEAAKEESEVFPSPERIDKVEESMGNLENVVRERNKAYWQLEVSPCATGERPALHRRDVFGRLKYYKCSQHLVPYRSNNIFRNLTGPGKQEECGNFFRLYREQQRKLFNSKRSQKARYLRNLLRRFPNADVEYLQELNPEFPPGYIKHLRENLVDYDDPPPRCIETNVKIENQTREFNQTTKKLLE